MNERDIVAKACRGDRQAFADIVLNHQARLRAFVACHVQNNADVFDIVQDAFLEALKNLDRFDANRDLGSWLRGICQNRVRNYYRERRTRRSADLARVDEALEKKLIALPEPSDEALERVEALKQCLDELSEDHRGLVALRYHASTAIKDIAAKLDRTADGVSKTLGRIRATLMKCVAKRRGKRVHGS